MFGLLRDRRRRQPNDTLPGSGGLLIRRKRLAHLERLEQAVVKRVVGLSLRRTWVRSVPERPRPGKAQSLVTVVRAQRILQRAHYPDGNRVPPRLQGLGDFALPGFRIE